MGKENIFRLISQATIRYITINVMGVLIILGLFSVYDSVFYEKPPAPIVSLGKNSDFRALAFKVPKKNESNWDAMVSALDILDQVAPNVSEWVRLKQDNDQIVWIKTIGIAAKYDYVSGVLSLNKDLLLKDNGAIAAILAHEYRHSLQNFTKSVKSIFTYLVLGKFEEGVIENDAYLYEQEVYLSIFG